MKPSLLVVDDEVAFLESMAYSLKVQGYDDVTTLSDPTKVPMLLDQRQFDLAFLDINMPGMDGLELLGLLKEKSPTTECVMITANESVPLVVQAIKLGAYDYLVKPIEPDQLYHAMDRALEHKQLLEVVASRQSTDMNDLLEQPEAFQHILTCDPGMLQLLREAELHARSDIPILVTGETGVGKELVARAIHNASSRSDGPFVAVNMLALPQGLFESALFGHAKGAFTGATESQPGYLGQAQGGTLFLDEIGDLPMELQGKLLRVLQEREYTPVGRTRPRQADVRFVAATHQDLPRLVEQGTFRNDLYYRLRFAQLRIPPLRHRKDDIHLLARTLLQQSIRPAITLPSETVSVLMRHDWPGNVRELQGLLEAAVNLAAEGVLLPQHLHLPTSGTSVLSASTTLSLDTVEPLAEVERKHILAAYEAMDNNKTHTAKALGVSLPTLHRKLKAYQVK